MEQELVVNSSKESIPHILAKDIHGSTKYHGIEDMCIYYLNEK